MALARQRAMWQPFSALMALLANCHTDPKKKVYHARDYDPFAKPERPIRGSIRDLAGVWGIKRKEAGENAGDEGNLIRNS